MSSKGKTGAEIYVRSARPDVKCRRWRGSFGRFQVRISDTKGRFSVVLSQGKTKAAAWYAAYKVVWNARNNEAGRVGIVTSEGMKVPEDLREMYEYASGYGRWGSVSSPQAKILIERIAKAESERDRMREALREAENRHVEFMVQGGRVVMASEYDAVVAERNQLRDSLQEFLDELPEDRCPDPHCGGECAIRRRAEEAIALGAARAALSEAPK